MQKGFTLIELLIVIAIIGILSSIVLITLSDETGKAKDAKFQFELRQILTVATIYNVGDGDGSFTGLCGYSKIQPILKSIGITASCTGDSCEKPSGGATAACYSGIKKWVVYTKLSDGTTYQCVDSTGISKKTTTKPTSSTKSCG